MTFVKAACLLPPDGREVRRFRLPQDDNSLSALRQRLELCFARYYHHNSNDTADIDAAATTIDYASPTAISTTKNADVTTTTTTTTATTLALSWIDSDGDRITVEQEADWEEAVRLAEDRNGDGCVSLLIDIVTTPTILSGQKEEYDAVTSNYRRPPPAPPSGVSPSLLPSSFSSSSVSSSMHSSYSSSLKQQQQQQQQNRGSNSLSSSIRNNLLSSIRKGRTLRRPSMNSPPPSPPPPKPRLPAALLKDICKRRRYHMLSSTHSAPCTKAVYVYDQQLGIWQSVEEEEEEKRKEVEKQAEEEESEGQCGNTRVRTGPHAAICRNSKAAKVHKEQDNEEVTEPLISYAERLQEARTILGRHIRQRYAIFTTAVGEGGNDMAYASPSRRTRSPISSSSASASQSSDKDINNSPFVKRAKMICKHHVSPNREDLERALKRHLAIRKAQIILLQPDSLWWHATSTSSKTRQQQQAPQTPTTATTTTNTATTETGTARGNLLADIRHEAVARSIRSIYNP